MLAMNRENKYEYLTCICTSSVLLLHFLLSKIFPTVCFCTCVSVPCVVLLWWTSLAVFLCFNVILPIFFPYLFFYSFLSYILLYFALFSPSLLSFCVLNSFRCTLLCIADYLSLVFVCCRRGRRWRSG